MTIEKQQKWKTVEYSRSKIIKAGKKIKEPNASLEEIEEATRIIDNWRAAHAFPMHVIYMHLRRMANKQKDIIVAERLKRLDSIIKKLEREPSMSLWTMQDLGGCRFIVPTIEDVYRFADKYDASRKRHIFVSKSDYIAFPKTSGYRSVHMVYEYRSDRIDTYNKNMLIEIQYRTHLQHIWATALETMGIFTRQNLKANQGNEYIKRFFALVSSLFAMEEKCPLVPGTSTDRNELIAEARTINVQYNVLDTLSAIRVFSGAARDIEMKKSGYYMLILNFNSRNLNIRYFSPSEIEKANEIYSQIERTRAERKIDAVLVRAESYNDLKKAYPNYFADISEFFVKTARYLR